MRHETPITTRRTPSSLIQIQSISRGQGGSALVTAAMFCAIASLIFISVFTWAGNHGRLVRRQQEFLMAQYVAEAGVEKVYAAIRSNVNATSVSPVQSALNLYATNQLPNSTDNSFFSNYRYVTSSGTSNMITVTNTAASATNAISSGTYAGLNALIMPYRIIARANSFNRPVNLTTGVQRDIQIQNIPIFQFAVFYNGDMEIEPGAPMTIGGKVHSNGTAYIAPNSTLTFQDTLTAAIAVDLNPMPVDSHQPVYNAPVYDSTVTTPVSPLTLPLGSASNAHDLIEPPPGSGTDPISTQRMYNQAGLIIKVSNTGVTAINNSGSTVSGITVGSTGNKIISTNKSLYDYREGVNVQLTELDISQLISASKVPANGIVYVYDTRTAYSETAIRLINGDTLPSGGLTVVTDNPLYILGNYNSAHDYPASIMSDSVNILSGSWNDAQSNHAMDSSHRQASDTTVDAALFTGNVPTTAASYSGGLENLPRFLEDWSGNTFTYNGSMVVYFSSETATGLWANASYNAPNRNWSFDNQFLNATKLPPGTPSIRTLSRVNWASIQ